MKRFFTTIYVKDELTNEKFIEMVFKWAKKSPHYTFGDIDWDNSEEFIAESADKMQTLSIIRFKGTIAVRLTNKVDKVIWTNDYVLTEKNGRRVLSVQLNNDAIHMSAKMSDTYNKPYLFKKIISKGYADSDNGLETNGCYVRIDNKNIGIIEDIILDKAEYLMPVVYVTKTAFTDNYMVDCKELARELSGIAHVVAEKDKTISRRLKESTGGKNPYNSAVQIYFEKGASRRMLYSYDNKEIFRKEIVKAVSERLCMGKIDEDLSFLQIRIKMRISKIKEEADVNEELAALYEEDKNELKERIEELRRENAALKNKADYYKSSFDNANADSDSANSILLCTKENNLYESEQVDVVLKVIAKELKTMESDSNQKETRKFHIINSIIEQNKIENKSKKMIEDVKKLFSSSMKVNKSFLGSVEELGFEIEKNGGHYKLYYRGDPRLAFTLYCTASEGRSGSNLASEINFRVFGID